MNAIQQMTWALDGWIILAGILCSVAASLLGTFLVLRNMSMLGDAISHAVLPGLAAAFFLSDSRSSLPMFVGAVIVGLLTTLFTEWIRSFGRVDEGASMGVVFTSLFALGLVMIVQAADHVDLDPGCVLYGAIELIALPGDTWGFAGFEAPRVVVMLAIVLAINLLFVVLFFKELKISSFDPALASNVGFNARLMHYLLMTLVAVTAVASFESVGNILVVAMFVVPPAAALMLTDRLVQVMVISALLAATSAVGGHVSALVVPAWFGYKSTSTAGMIAVVAGLLFLLAACFGPRHGIVVRLVRHWLLAWQILADDVLALLFRMHERDAAQAATRRQLQSLLLSGPILTRLALAIRRRQGLVRRAPNEGYLLTEAGMLRAQRLVRSHRLWEQYLVTEAGVAAERIHEKAERLEHFTDRDLRSRLDSATAAPQTDPHGSPIPPESP